MESFLRTPFKTRHCITERSEVSLLMEPIKISFFWWKKRVFCYQEHALNHLDNKKRHSFLHIGQSLTSHFIIRVQLASPNLLCRAGHRGNKQPSVTSHCAWLLCAGRRLPAHEWLIKTTRNGDLSTLACCCTSFFFFVCVWNRWGTSHMGNVILSHDLFRHIDWRWRKAAAGHI